MIKHSPVTSDLLSKYLDLWNNTNSESRAIVQYMFPYGDEWRTDIVYPNITFLIFEYLDRGIVCWKLFSDFIHKVFPNLKHLILSQNYSYSTDFFFDFYTDQWLDTIWINDDQSRFPNIYHDLPELPKIRYVSGDCVDYDTHRLLYRALKDLLYICPQTPHVKLEKEHLMTPI